MPKPYGKAFLQLFLGFTLLTLLATGVATAAEKTGKKQQKTSEKAKSVVPSTNLLGRKLAQVDADTQAGMEALYSLEYEKAIAAFETAAKHYPQDPYALNHLLQAMLLRELFRLNALDTTLYADNGFLTGKPLAGDPKIREQIFSLSDRAIALCDARLKTNQQDVEALYARGVSRGLKLSYIALVEKSFFPALRNAMASRNDHDRVLELDPSYPDAKLVVGVHSFILGSMPLAARIMAGIVGIHGDKKRGIDYLYEVGRSHAENSAEARVTLSLFLRREGKYSEALEVMKTLTAEYPRNFIFALEQANLLKDAGKGEAAVQQFEVIVKNAKAGVYPSMHIERAYFGLAESLKGQRKVAEALEAYTQALQVKDASQDLRLWAMLGAGQMLDALAKRDSALKQYHEVVTTQPDSQQAASARAYMKQPFRFPG